MYEQERRRGRRKRGRVEKEEEEGGKEKRRKMRRWRKIKRRRGRGGGGEKKGRIMAPILTSSPVPAPSNLRAPQRWLQAQASKHQVLSNIVSPVL